MWSGKNFLTSGGNRMFPMHPEERNGAADDQRTEGARRRSDQVAEAHERCCEDQEPLESQLARKPPADQTRQGEGGRRDHADRADLDIVERYVRRDVPDDGRDGRDGRPEVEGDQRDPEEGQCPTGSRRRRPWGDGALVALGHGFLTSHCTALLRPQAAFRQAALCR